MISVEMTARFWSKVDVPPSKSSATCWTWNGSKGPKGYGLFKRPGGATQRSHRASWEIANGEIAGDLHVLHKCDNPSCVRPSHLFLGTNQENVDDRVKKGRTVVPSGESHHNAKITQSDADFIRTEWAEKKASQRILAKKFGVSQNTIWAIIHNKFWVKK